MSKIVNIMIAGLGTVGSGVVNMLEKQNKILEKKANLSLIHI